MTFEEKVSGCYQNYKDIDKPVYSKAKLYLYSDFVELMILFSNEDGVTKGDIQDRFFGTKEYVKTEKRDEDESFIDGILRTIEERIFLYKSKYPFNYENNKILKLKSNLNWRNRMYLNLLISSNLNIYSHFQSILTTEFETFSANALKNFLPKNAIIREFGENSTYKGYAIDKIKKLSSDLKIDYNQKSFDAIDPKNLKERGLDIIGWIPFNDNCKNKIIFICQCACGKNFESKFHETQRFKNYFNFYRTFPQNTMFIPYSMLNIHDNEFLHTDIFIEHFLIFERKRILFLNDKSEFIKSESDKIVKAFINFKEEII